MPATGNVTIRGQNPHLERKIRVKMETKTMANDDEGNNDEGNNDEPPSCFGHFDRLDVEYTPKPAAQAQVWVIHDGRSEDAWTNPPLLQNNRNSRRWDSSAAAAAATERSIRHYSDPEESETEGRRTPTREGEVGFDVGEEEDDDEAPDEDPLSSRASSLEAEEDTPTLSPQSPRRMLKKLRVSHTAVRVPQAEDPYFAGRLAQMSLLMIHDGHMVEAKRLGRWGIDLVGEKEWDKVVEYYGSEPRLETDNGDLMVLILLDVDINLRPIDEARAEELRGMSLEWQDMGILPRRSE